MYKSETQRFIERALNTVLSKTEAVGSKLSPEEQVQLASLLTDDLWAAGYELEPRMSLRRSPAARSASAS